MFQNEEAPPLPLESDSSDLVWAVSVFTHITGLWAAWLPSGLPVAPSEADRVGMSMLNHGRSWDEGGPTVFHSEWWIREHWGRAFDIGSVEQQGVMLGPQWNGQGVVMLRKRAAEITAEEFERIDPSDEREIEALRHNLRQLHHESLTAREAVNWLQSQGATENLTGIGE